MTDNTQELDGLLNAYLNACVYSQGNAWEEEEAVKEAKQAILDWHNKQTLELLDRLYGELMEEGETIVHQWQVEEAIEAERQQLNPSKSTPFGKLKESK